MKDNLEKFTEMCEDMERRHRRELQQLRESYEGRQFCYMLILVFCWCCILEIPLIVFTHVK